MLPATPRIPQQNPSSRHETEFPSGTGPGSHDELEWPFCCGEYPPLKGFPGAVVCTGGRGIGGYTWVLALLEQREPRAAIARYRQIYAEVRVGLESGQAAAQGLVAARPDPLR